MLQAWGAMSALTALECIEVACTVDFQDFAKFATGAPKLVTVWLVEGLADDDIEEAVHAARQAAGLPQVSIHHWCSMRNRFVSSRELVSCVRVSG